MSDKNLIRKYVSYCHDHGWQGMQRESYSEAQLDLDGHIGYFPDESHSDSGVTVLKDNTFKVFVLNENKSSVKLILCTGEEISIPRSLISELEHVGSSLSEEKKTDIYLLSLNITTEEGQLVYDLSKIIQKNLDKNVFKTATPVAVYGKACQANFSYFDCNFDIAGFAYNSATDCSYLEVIKTGKRQLRIKHTGTYGTRCDDYYNGKVYIDIW